MLNFEALTADLNRSLAAFLPELVLIAGMILMLLGRLFPWGQRFSMSWLALSATVLSLLAAFWQHKSMIGAEEFLGQALLNELQSGGEIFSGLLVYDPFTTYFKIFLLLFAALVVVLTMLTGIPDRLDSPDFYTLLLGATLGMLLMSSANHLLMVFVSIEMASVPSYAMAGFLKGRKTASEAALKYVVYGGGAAGVMLYGISLLAGMFGTGHLPTLTKELARVAAEHPVFDAHLAMMALAVLLVMVGIFFKLAAVPFHFWCPDVFEGAAAEVAAFLSVASKGAALALLVRLTLGTQIAAEPSMGPFRLWLGTTLAVFAAMTATFGNLAAYAQTNLKRLLAYSTIAHAGYMMMPVAAALIMIGQESPVPDRSVSATTPALQSLLFYLVVYLFMNLGAFAIVAFLRNEIRSEDLSDYKGLGRACPGLAVCMAIFMLSLTGIPPLAGFFGKFYIFAVLFEAGRYNTGMYWLLVIAAINTVISLFYYVKVLRVMILERAPLENSEVRISLDSPAGLYSLVVSLPVLFAGVWWGAYELTQPAASMF